MGPPHVWTSLGAGLRRRRPPAPHDRPGLEVGGASGTQRTPHHRRGTLGPLGPGGRRPTRGWWRRDLPVPLDARVWVGGPPAVSVRDRLGRRERRQHGDDTPDRYLLRGVAVRA